MQLASHLNKKLFLKNNKMLPTRLGFGEAVTEIAEKDESIVVITADLEESTKVDGFAKTYPKRFIQAGVAEQNMAGVAAGLALSGKIPFMTSYGVFSPGRNWDQIRVSICYSKANVKIFSSHTGLSAAADGATHQALEDLALTLVLPNLVVLSPCDYEETKKAVRAATKHMGPVYIRACRESTPEITTDTSPFELGKAYVIAEGDDLSIFAHGPILAEALSAAKELEENHKVKCEVINVPTLKPLDEETVLASVKKTGKAIVLEEHQTFGGLGSVISQVLTKKYPVHCTSVGIKDTFTESGTYLQLKNKYEVDSYAVVKMALDMLKR